MLYKKIMVHYVAVFSMYEMDPNGHSSSCIVQTAIVVDDPVQTYENIHILLIKIIMTILNI